MQISKDTDKNIHAPDGTLNKEFNKDVNTHKDKNKEHNKDVDSHLDKNIINTTDSNLNKEYNKDVNTHKDKNINATQHQSTTNKTY